VFEPGEKELRNGRNVFSDEELIVSSCAAGLCSGLDSVVITRDRGVYDQFSKLTQLLTWHYFSLLFAERYVSDRDRYEVVPMPIGDRDIEPYFVSENSVLVRKPVNPEQFVEWLLPSQFSPVRLHCILLAGDGPSFLLDQCLFEAERDMKRIIDMKGRARGWNTDRIFGRNCHITGFPRSIVNPRHFVAIVQDREDIAPNGTLSFPRLELNHALHHLDVAGQVYA
jgi:hypothetical protein